MPKPLPAALEELIPPHNHYRYFEAASATPFRPAEQDFCIANAWWCAEASMLAYSDQPFAQAAMPPGWSYEHIECPPGSTQAFAMHAAGVRIIAFRGTELASPAQLILDVRTDIQLLPVHANGLSSQALVHRGFWNQYGLVAALIEKQMTAAGRAGQKVWFTGHSLGGALAFLGAAMNPQAQGVYTFGMPRVGNHALNASPALQGKLHRFVHASDLIPHLPPNYEHSSKAHFISRSGELELRDLDSAADVSAMSRLPLQDLLQSFAKPFNLLGGLFSLPSLVELPRAFLDHSPIYYAPPCTTSGGEGAGFQEASWHWLVEKLRTTTPRWL